MLKIKKCFVKDSESKSGCDICEMNIYQQEVYYKLINASGDTCLTLCSNCREELIKQLTILGEPPETCKECPYYNINSYRCHNEVGEESTCSIGSMQGEDMRDKLYINSRYPGCLLVKPKLVKKRR